MKIKLISIMAFAVILSFYSCSKTSNSELINDIVPIQKDKTAQKIINFGQTVKDVKNGLKSGDEKMSVEDATWNIEAALNYYNYTASVYDNMEFITEKSFIDIFPENEELTMLKISEIATEMNALINNDNEKSLLSADIKVVDKEDGTKVMEMTTVKVKSRILPTPIDTWDYWSMEGSCTDDYPLEWGSPEILRALVNQFALGGWYERHINTYYTDVETHHIGGYQDGLLNPNDDVTWDYYLDSYLYHDFADIPHCLEPEEMEFYSEIGIPTVITSNMPNDLAFVNIEVIYNDFPANNDVSETDYYHSIDINYGIPHPYTFPQENPLDE